MKPIDNLGGLAVLAQVGCRRHAPLHGLPYQRLKFDEFEVRRILMEF
jgi:hypothetical protein